VLVGYVPPYITLRLRGIQQSGLLEWWNDFISSSGNIPIYRSKQHEAPTMKGSILVIFLVLFSGWAISFSVYLLEVRIAIASFIWKNMSKFCRLGFCSFVLIFEKTVRFSQEH